MRAVLHALPWAVLAALYAVADVGPHARWHLLGVCLAALAVDVLRSVGEGLALRTARARALREAMQTVGEAAETSDLADRVTLYAVAVEIARLNDKETES